MYLPESELIINPDGSIYHLNLRPEQLAKTVITVGDPDRVDMVSRHFDHIECRVQKREFVTHTGTLGAKRISVVSTGIGTDNIDIVLNELDALVNIDFEKRMPLPSPTSLDIIRIGTSGCLQADVPLDSFLVTQYGIGMDGLLNFYSQKISSEEKDLLSEFEAYLNEPHLPKPYIASGSASLIEKIGKKDMLRGITLTCPGFYAPQGRALRVQPNTTDFIPKLNQFKYKNYRLTNFEMETAGIYGLARALGHNALSCNALIADRINHQFSKTPTKTVEKLIETVLQRLMVESTLSTRKYNFNEI